MTDFGLVCDFDDPKVMRDLMRHVRLQRPAWPWEAAKRERFSAAYLRRRLLATIARSAA